jgi:hypothetical protein
MTPSRLEFCNAEWDELPDNALKAGARTRESLIHMCGMMAALTNRPCPTLRLHALTHQCADQSPVKSRGNLREQGMDPREQYYGRVFIRAGMPLSQYDRTVIVNGHSDKRFTPSKRPLPITFRPILRTLLPLRRTQSNEFHPHVPHDIVFSCVRLHPYMSLAQFTESF